MLHEAVEALKQINSASSNLLDPSCEHIGEMLMRQEQELRAASDVSLNYEKAYLAMVSARVAFERGQKLVLLEALREAIESLDNAGAANLSALDMSIRMQI